MTMSTKRLEPTARSVASDGKGIPERILFGRWQALGISPLLYKMREGGLRSRRPNPATSLESER